MLHGMRVGKYCILEFSDKKLFFSPWSLHLRLVLLQWPAAKASVSQNTACTGRRVSVFKYKKYLMFQVF
jgi:hypothetical protein